MYYCLEESKLKKERNIRSLLLFLGIIIVVLLAIQPIPYYVTMPGSAQEIDPFVDVEGAEDEDGELMLVTVSMGRANIVRYMFAKMRDYEHIFTEEEMLGDADSEEYDYQQLQMMQNAQSSAIEVAYKRAGKDVSVVNNGVIVLGIEDDMPVAKELQVGDVITGIDGQSITTADELINYVQTKTVGEVIEITCERNGKKETISSELQQIDDTGRVGLGIQIQTVSELETEPKVTIDTDEIGGPSAGMMFTLEIYDQLTEGDLAKGHKIAGTGTISSDGTVGPIGGIDQKVVAADKAGAEIFFAPTYELEGGSNYDIAVETAKDIKTDMEIVPVGNVEDAFTYLDSLEEK